MEAIILTIITASTPLLLAAIGELVVERSGVLNLGVEGMMIMGAVCGFGAAHFSGSAYLGVLAGLFGGMILAMLFAVLTQILVTNQVATGLALTMLGLGLSGLIGESLVGLPGTRLNNIAIPGLSSLPLVGPLLFSHDLLVYASVLVAMATSYVLFRTRTGLVIRAVGDNHHSAHALGYNVVLVRFCCILFGGAMAGLAGAYLSLAYTPQWTENMTVGRGWIALALVVFASWLPGRLVAGAYLFGSVWIMGLYAQAIDLQFPGGSPPSQLLSALPYLVTIFVLVIISRNRQVARIHTPAMIGKPFVPDY